MRFIGMISIVYYWPGVNFHGSVAMNLCSVNDTEYYDIWKVLQIRTTCHARDLWNWLGLVNSWITHARQTRGIYQILLKSVEIHWVRQCFENAVLLNKGPVNIWNEHKNKKQLVRRTCKYFHNFWHGMNIYSMFIIYAHGWVVLCFCSYIIRSWWI